MISLLLGCHALSLSPTRVRAEVRDELLRELPREQPPALPSARLQSLVDELEGLAVPPATSDFLVMGLQGEWSLQLQSGLSESTELLLPADRGEPVCIKRVTQRVEEGKLRSTAQFEVPIEGLSGSLEVQADLYPTTRPDMLHFVSRGHTLNLERAPNSIAIPGLMNSLLGHLSAEFRAEDGVRFGLQITYIDELVRITRCTTRDFAGFCTVHSRVAR
ncbi:MAG: hypothetical protein SGPRY_003652 [Prymnesium sp.]